MVKNEWLWWLVGAFGWTRLFWRLLGVVRGGGIDWLGQTVNSKKDKQTVIYGQRESLNWITPRHESETAKFSTPWNPSSVVFPSVFCTVQDNIIYNDPSRDEEDEEDPPRFGWRKLFFDFIFFLIFDHSHNSSPHPPFRSLRLGTLDQRDSYIFTATLLFFGDVALQVFGHFFR